MIQLNRARAPRRRRVLTTACAGAFALVGTVTFATSVSATTPDTTEPVDAAASEIRPVALTLTEASIDGLPADLAAGLIEVSVTDETEASGGEVNFAMVEPGTDPAAFSTALAEVFVGGPFADFFLSNAGAVDGTITVLDEGEYIVWVDLASNLDRPSTVDDLVTASLTVGPGDDDAAVPPQDSGSILAGDYVFDVDAIAGGTTATFTNTSDNQFHHVVVMDFGTNDPALIEQNALAIIASEGDDLPEGIDPSQITEAGFSAVFGPGGSGTFALTFEEGHTYVALCFLPDREGGDPHALLHDMYEVFQVDAA